jgi:hypothetical protein
MARREFAKAESEITRFIWRSQKSASKGLLAVGWRIVVGGLAHRFFGGLEYPTQAL